MIARIVVVATLALQLLVGTVLGQDCAGTAFCDNSARGLNSVAFGTGNEASSYASLVIGRYSYSPGSPAVWNDPDTLFAAGNGVGPNLADRSNALFLTKKGDLTIASALTSKGLRTNNCILEKGGLISLGDNCRSAAPQGVTFGINTRVDGTAGVSLGVDTTATAYASLAIGRFNTRYGSTTTWVDTDPLFVAGNGLSSSQRSDALTLLKNGDLSISGGFTARTFKIPNSFAVGENSQAFGSHSLANASNSATFGQDTFAYGSASLALGVSTIADGNASISGGIGTIASAPGSLVIGTYNEPDVGSVFVVGAGASDSDRRNAFTINNRGDVFAQGVISASQIKSPNASVDKVASAAFGGSTASGVGAVAMGVQSNAFSYSSLAIGQFNSKSKSASAVEWKPCDVLFVAGNGKSAGNPHDALRLYKSGILLMASYVFHFSDNRYTDSPASLANTNVLAKLMRLEPVTFRWNADEAETRGDSSVQVGIMAQNMQKTFPELVFTGEDDRMAVDYSRLSVFAVQAVKELSVDVNARITSLTSQVTPLKRTVDNQQETITALKKTVDKQQEAITALKKTVDKQQATIVNMLKLLCEHRNKRKRNDPRRDNVAEEHSTRDLQHDDDEAEHEGNQDVIFACNDICKK